jgi:predicted alpha-1,6-mannanase (GH76 family)
MNRRVIVALIGVFAIGAALGLAVALAVRDSNGSPSEQDCAEAEAVIAASNERLGEISAVETEQDASFFAAILVEQRTIAFAMDAEPACFTLAERAGAEGLLDGVRALVAVADLDSGALETVPDSGSGGEPGAGTDDPPAPDEGE